MFRHRFDVGTMLHLFEINVKNLAFVKQINSLIKKRTLQASYDEKRKHNSLFNFISSNLFSIKLQ